MATVEELMERYQTDEAFKKEVDDILADEIELAAMRWEERNDREQELEEEHAEDLPGHFLF